jgi:hypothetical protein
MRGSCNVALGTVALVAGPGHVEQRGHSMNDKSQTSRSAAELAARSNAAPAALPARAAHRVASAALAAAVAAEEAAAETENAADAALAAANRAIAAADRTRAAASHAAEEAQALGAFQEEDTVLAER